jgi:hypothetical protein
MEIVTLTISSPHTATRAVDRLPGRQRLRRRQGDRTPDEESHRSGEDQRATRKM